MYSFQNSDSVPKGILKILLILAMRWGIVPVLWAFLGGAKCLQKLLPMEQKRPPHSCDGQFQLVMTGLEDRANRLLSCS